EIGWDDKDRADLILAQNAEGFGAIDELRFEMFAGFVLCEHRTQRATEEGLILINDGQLDAHRFTLLLAAAAESEADDRGDGEWQREIENPRPWVAQRAAQIFSDEQRERSHHSRNSRPVSCRNTSLRSEERSVGKE